MMGRGLRVAMPPSSMGHDDGPSQVCPAPASPGMAFTPPGSPPPGPGAAGEASDPSAPAGQLPNMPGMAGVSSWQGVGIKYMNELTAEQKAEIFRPDGIMLLDPGKAADLIRTRARRMAADHQRLMDAAQQVREAIPYSGWEVESTLNDFRIYGSKPPHRFVITRQQVDEGKHAEIATKLATECEMRDPASGREDIYAEYERYGSQPIKPTALKPGDLAYLRSRIQAMAAFTEADRRSGIVVDREFVQLLSRHFGAGAPNDEATEALSAHLVAALDKIKALEAENEELGRRAADAEWAANQG